MQDRKPLLSDHEALVEANRCLYCSDAPCIPSCPTHIDIPEFIRQLSTGNVLGSAKTILSANILGYSCARVCPVEVLCEGTCVYNELHEKPIKIGRLQRYATERAYDKGVQFFDAAPDTGRRVALIGAGPASLACAHALRTFGHSVVIFEARQLPGGLNSTGVAPYKLFAPDALREVDYVTAIGGIDIRYGQTLGRDLTLAQLEADFDAIFIGAGLGPDSALSIPGQDLPGVIGAVDWIERVKLDPAYALSAGLQDVAIIGGGNTALDVVRESLALRVPNVHLIYRRDQATMSGYAHEWTEAKIEGAHPHWFSQPVAFIADDAGHVCAVRCARTQLTRDADGNDKLVTTNITFDVPASQVILAIGQSTLGHLLADVPGVTITRGRVSVDAGGRTGNPKYFAGGDCANGGKEVVNASAEGKAAALSIHALLSSLTTQEAPHA
jgi:dihydropyrimidine dehydrogenase (NAD+) subunit PreT